MIRKIGRRLWMFLAVLTIVLAVAISLARFSLPFMDEYRDEIISVLSRQLGQPLDVTTIVAEWHGLGPRIRLVGLTLLDKDSAAPLLALNNIAFGIDILESLMTRKLQISSVILEGINLSVTRDIDGNITLQGLGEGRKDKSGKGGRLFAAWLLSRDHISITANQIKWQDMMRGGSMRHIHELSIKLRNNRKRHQLDGTALLPGLEDQRITFAVDIQGDILESGNWNGEAYIEAKSIQLAQLPQGLVSMALRADQGVATAMVWSAWKKGQLLSVKGRATIENMHITRLAGGSAIRSGSGQVANEDSRHFGFKMASGDFSWKRQQQGWGLALKNFEFERAGRTWPATDMQFAMSGIVQETPEVAAQFSYLDVRDVSDIVAVLDVLPPATTSRIAELKPAGRLYNASLHYIAENKFDASASFKKLAIDNGKKLPGFAGIDGRFVANEHRGLLQINATGTRVGYEGVLRAPFAIGRIDGSITWEKAAQSWQIRAENFRVETDDIHLRTKMEMEWPVDRTQSPRLDLLASFEAPTIENTSRYLPAGVMKPGLVTWMDHALIAGRIPYGEVMFHGRLDRFPFKQGDGVFEVRFNVVDGILDYAEGWPRIEEMDAEIVFNNKSMEINVVDGKSLSSTLTEARISIPDLAGQPAMLMVDGRAEGATSEALRFLRESPLNKKFGPYFSEATAAGQAELILRLKKPLIKAPPEINGHLQLTNSRLLLTPDGLELSHINGELKFTDQGLFAEDIESTVLGMQSDINIQTVQEQGQAVTHIYSVGTIAAGKLAELLVAPLFKNMEGETLWNAAITIPPVDPAGKVNASLLIQSDLKGLAINLPVPLAKQADQTLNLNLNIPLPRSRDAPLTFELSGLLNGILDVDEQMSIERGEIVLGNDGARLPDHYGLRLSGSTPYFSFSKWLPYLEDAEDIPPRDQQSLVRSVSMAIRQVELFGHEFHAVEARAIWRPDYWDISAISDEMKGDVEYPRKEGIPLVMNLDYLHIREAEGDEGDEMDPRDMPEIRVTSKLFTLYEANLGALEMHAEKRPEGMHIDRINLTSDVMNVDAVGDWLIAPGGKQVSDFNIVFDSSNLGTALTRLGYVESIKDGSSHIEISAQWDGSPTSFSRGKVRGNMALRIENGRLLDIEPGAGRIFGLVNLRALPRRLSLDFSDIFDKGFAFDRISGNFRFANGIATTRDLKMKGPAAKVEISGKIDVLQRTYDQVVTVMPELSAGLPVAGAVVGGIGVAAAILLAEQLFKPEIEKATRVKYSVTGSWDDPEIIPLQP